MTSVTLSDGKEKPIILMEYRPHRSLLNAAADDTRGLYIVAAPETKDGPIVGRLGNDREQAETIARLFGSTPEEINFDTPTLSAEPGRRHRAPFFRVKGSPFWVEKVALLPLENGSFTFGIYDRVMYGTRPAVLGDFTRAGIQLIPKK